MPPRKAKIPASKPAPGRAAHPDWFFPFLLCVVVVAAYANSLSLGLAMDSAALVEDPRLHAFTLANVERILHEPYWWGNTRAGLYRPVTTLSLLFNYTILGNGTAGAGYHFINLVLHAVNVCLVFRLALLLVPAEWPAFFTAALWAVHPAAVESVTNVAGRGDLLATMALVGALVWYARRTRAPDSHPAVTIAVLLALALCGVFSKESGAGLAGLLLLWDLSYRPGQGVADWLRRWPAYATALASAAVFFWVRRNQPPMFVPVVDNAEISADFWTARLTAVKVIGRYLRLLIFPLQLSSDYSYNQVHLASWGDLEAWLSLVVIVALLAAAIWRRRRDSLMFFAAGFFGITLLPSSNLLTIIGSIMAERFLYLPSIGFGIALAALIHRAGQRFGNERAAFAASALLMLAFGVRTFARNEDWRDELSLWSSDVAAAPDSFKVRKGLGSALFFADQDRNLDAALREFETSWRIVSDLPLPDQPANVMTDLGTCYRIKGDRAGGSKTAEGRAWYEKAAAILERAREVDRLTDRTLLAAERARGAPLPKVLGIPDLYQNLGNVYLNLGRTEEALEACRYGQLIEPHNPVFYVAIAAVEMARGNRDGAALALLEQTLVGSAKSGTEAQLRGLYAAFPDGGCAFTDTGNGWKLNTGCPRVQRDVCAAYLELAKIMVAGRQPAEALRQKQAASLDGCPMAAFDAVVPK